MWHYVELSKSPLDGVTAVNFVRWLFLKFIKWLRPLNKDKQTFLGIRRIPKMGGGVDFKMEGAQHSLTKFDLYLWYLFLFNIFSAAYLYYFIF